MNVLFITLLDIRDASEHNLYTDLIREFEKNNHSVYVISPIERRFNMKTQIINDNNHSGIKILKLKTGNIQKTNLIEKGISTVLIEYQIKNAIKKYFSDIHFDLVLYSTPPITIVKPIKFVKNRDNARTYLMLKDIFPQNAVDLGMMSKSGVKGLLYRYFRNKEKKLYSLSDKIGCMSPANVKYVLEHNSQISPEKVEICPNSIEIQDINITTEQRNNIRNKYGIPKDKTVFVYGGNLGKPQGIPFIIECLKSQEKNDDVFFLIVGDGTEFCKLKSYFDEVKPKNMKLMNSLPKEDYDNMISACDVGLIFLDYRFTIPNFPSRLLSYMQAGIPVLAVIDNNSDIGNFLVDNGIGDMCSSNDFSAFCEKIDLLKNNTIEKQTIFNVLTDYFGSYISYDSILKSLQ